MVSLRSKFGVALLAIAWMCAMAAAAVSPAAGQVLNCLPTCSATDGRFLAISGSNLINLSENKLNLTISVPAGTTTFQLGIFDGDAGALDVLNVSHWDTGVLATYEYTLYADPAANGSGTTQVNLAPGSPSVLSSAMPDNAWATFNITTSPNAQAPSGHYFYRLNIQLLNPSLTTTNAFKVRSDAMISGTTINPVAQPFSYIANLRGLADIQIIYPNYPNAVPTNYDGTFSFYFDVPVTQQELMVWDGDFDRGRFDGADLDTDDPDTPNAPFRPTWATSSAVSEGVAVGSAGTTGNPPDDRNPAGSGIYNSKPPSVQYEVIFPNGQVFLNTNPSGNSEWEQFRISTDPFDPAADYYAESIPPGIYQFKGIGVDMQNLNALLLPARVLCISEAGQPCQPLRPFMIGDTVFSDANGDGVQDPDEPGIANVIVELLDYTGAIIATTTTDADGHYDFEVEAGSYTVQISADNFIGEIGGVLVGYENTTPETCFANITNDNEEDCDFGYQGRGSIGNRVWYDANANGVQDAGEPGLNGVLVDLVDGNGDVLETQTTDGDGNYQFLNVDAGTYTVRVDMFTLANGAVPTYDLDGVATPHETLVTLGAAQHRMDVDFGYVGDAAVGDRVWSDADGDGVQDAGEAGINGVTVYLYDIYIGDVVATTVTSGDGNYAFAGIFESTYQVQIDTGTLPAGYTQTYDLDGLGTPDYVELSVFSGETRNDVDFGYRNADAPTGSIGDRVWIDSNGDGVQDAGETGVNGATVELLDADGNVAATTATAGDGNYTFSNLAAGTYTVRVVAGTLPAGVAPTFDADGIATPNVATVSLASGATVDTVDFGYRGTASVGDRVWYDGNGDGAQDAGETGINGVTVELLDAASTVIATTTTAGDGNYAFSFLMGGNYSVRVVAASLPPGVAQTYDLDGVGTPHAASFILAGGQNRTDVDFGYRGTGSVGDRLWLDTNGDGVQDAGEAGINGVTVQLFNGDGNLIATTATAGDGVYGFNNLGAGTYTVRIVSSTLPAGVEATYDLDGVATLNEATFTLGASASRDDVDFGYRGTASVGDRVWNDTDGDGVQDAGEAGINGVTVELLDSTSTVIATTATSGDGAYTFSYLLGGSYSVRVVSSTLPAGLAPTYDLDGVGTAHVASFTLNAGDSRTDVDFGYRGTASVGDRVWNDTNGNGAQDAGEAGINGVTVELLDSASNVVATATTAGDGNYTFGNLSAGTYTVRVTAPAGLAPTYDLDGVGTAHEASFTLNAGDSRTDVDFGYRGTASVGDRVWYDANGNGAQDAGEAGINGVTVELLDGASNVVATTTTAGDGTYTFSNLNAGSYSVRVTAPVGMAPTYDLDGVGTAHVASFTLNAGDNRTDVDFGYRGTASVGDRVWNDANGNGAQDAGEAGINGVTVELLGGANNVVATTTTAGDGTYTFGNLNAGSYSVRVTAPAGMAPTYDLDGVGTAHVASLTLNAGDSRTDVDFGYRGTASVGDRIWRDSNGNGVQDAGEAGINGVTVELLDGASNVVATATTAGDGTYTFSNLNAGSYSVRVVTATLPAGLAPTYDLDGVDSANIASFSLAAGASRTDVDFGYRGTGSIGDRVWLDTNGNGVQDPGEEGINEVSLQLLDGTTILATATTTVDGNYTFGDLSPGTYTVRVVTSSLPVGVAPTYDVDGAATAHEANVTLPAEASRTDVDFGYRGTASIGDRLWLDTNGDGVQDAGETGINGATVQLVQGTTVLATATTAGDGTYTFANLNPGTYTVRVVASSLPAGVAPTYDLDGIATADEATFTLAAGVARTDVDFGYRGTASVGDRLWLDANGNGTQDAGEDGLNDVTVQLLDGPTVIAATTTSGDGNYSFNHLSPGTYTVRVVSATLPAGLAPTYDLDGTGTPHVATFTLGAGASRSDVDFGYRGTASVGDRLWLDANGNGTQDAGEGGLNGVTVELLDAGNNVIASTATSGDGNYAFANLTAGNYTVRVVSATLPAGLAPTYDLDGVGTPNVASFILTAGANRTDVDFGYDGTASIGDRVWTDADGDGVQDSGEDGINGVTVQLLDGASNVIATATTSGDGNYTFGNLLAGNYSVRVVSGTLPSGVTPSYDLDGVATAHTASFSLAAGANRTDVDFGYAPPQPVQPILECVAPNADGTYTAYFGYLNGNDVPVIIPVGPRNQFSPAPADRGQPTTFAPGRTPFWPNAAFGVVFDGNNLVWALDGHTSTASRNSTPCANHVFIDKEWLDQQGQPVPPPANLPGNFQITATSTLGTAVCTYPAGSTELSCTYDNNSPALDDNGLWVPVGSSYTVTETGLPQGGAPLSGTGTYTLPNGTCVPGRDGLQKHCTHTVQNFAQANQCVVRADLDPALGAGNGGHDFWLPGIGLDFIFTPNPGGFTTSGDGTAHLTGTIRSAADFNNAFTVDIQFSGFTTTAPAGSPKKELAASAYIENGGPVDPSGWWYYTSFTGTLTGIGNYAGAQVSIAKTGPAFQVGIGANNKNANFGASGWFNWTVTQQPASGNLQATGQGDINSDLIDCPPATASVGDRLWIDTDGDGAQDAGEVGINDATVQLLDNANNVLATATTSGDGSYSFTALLAGNYKVRVVSASLPAGLAPTYDLDGVATAHVASFSLAAGQDRTDVDFGYRGTASVGDRLWIDTDGDGVQDAGEVGINGVTVQLLDGDNNIAGTATTSGNGNYSFTNLGAGSYKVRVVSSTLPDGLAPTYDLDGVATPDTAAFSLGAGQSRTDVDFGYRGTSSVGDRVWHDANANGAQDAGETGINGVTVELLDANGIVVSSMATSGNGNYNFSSLLAGTYSVRVVASTLPAGVAPTYDLDGVATANVATFSLAGNTNRTDVDFGYRGTASVGDRLWIDADGDGVQDAGETGINGATVELLDANGNVVATTATSGNGNYTFANLLSGAYTVRVVTSSLPAGVAPTYDLDGTVTPNTATFSLNAGVSRTDVDFGYRGTASVGDRLWIDANGNGIQDAGETGINGATVQLLSGATVIATATTSGNGNYTFANLLGGTYTVQVVSASLPAGLAPTYDLDGVGTAHTATFTLAGGTSRTDVDFGYRGTASVGDRVWKDANGNGVQDAGEAGINGVTVELVDSNANVVATATTSGNGNYTFANLLAGTYTVRVVSASLPAGLAPTYDLDGVGTAHTTTVTLAAGASRTDVDFGYRGALSIGDRVWQDANGNGVQDATEAGINGVTVQLLNSSSTIIATTTTSGNGNYTFANLEAGTYTVRVLSTTLPAGYVATYDLDGIATAHTATLSLTVSRTDVDFGYRPATTAPGTGTIGYWKNHPEAWPVQTITLGNQTYTKAQAISLLGTASRGDKSIDLAKQLIGAKLNVIVGNNSSCISSTITAADNWLKQYPVGSNVSSSSAAWQTGGPLHTTLDNYNNGLMCAPHRG